jgi:hypothetical protein
VTGFGLPKRRLAIPRALLGPHAPERAEEEKTLVFEPHEHAFFVETMRRIDAAPARSEERAGMLNELQFVLALKWTFDARLLTEEEAWLGGFTEVRPESLPAPEEPRAEQLGFTADLEAAQAARDEAIRRVDTNADPQWKIHAARALREVAARRPDLTSDDVWIHLGSAPLEPRVMGPIMLAAQRDGVIAATDLTRQATRVVNHARPQRVWRSLVYGQGS